MSGLASRRRALAPAGLAALGGLLAAAAHPPYGLLPGLFGYALILWALDLSPSSPKPLRAAFLTGWAGGAGYLLLCTAWITEPFMIDVAEHGWQAPFAVIFCAGGIGLLWGGAGWLYRRLAPDPGSPAAVRVLVFTAAFALWEWLRGHALTGFPWDLPGETFVAGSALSQGAALLGAYGMSVVILFVGASLAVLAPRRAPTGERQGRLATLTVAAALVGVVGLWGEAYLRRPPPAAPPPLQVRLVQPNLPEPPAWSQAVLDRALDSYTRLSRTPTKPGAPQPTLVIWPEGAIPETFNALLAPGAETAGRLRESLTVGQTLLSGGVRVEPDPKGADPQGLYYNTLLAVRREPEGLRLLGVYDKHHLVPFGEYMPFARLLGPLGLRKLVSVSADFTPGPPPGPLHLPLGIVQPLICYEALFPGLAGGGATRPMMLVNVSDDAWFGRHAGPRQHLNIASYRAIEQGLPMLRATPTGVSAVIDGHGRALVRLEPGAEGVIDAPAPPALAPTVYSRLGDGPFWVMVLLGLASPWLYGWASKLLFDRNWLSPH